MTKRGRGVRVDVLPSVDRLEIVKDATAIEAAGGQWRVHHVAAVLDCALSTIYNTPWLLKIAKRVGKRGRRWVPAEVRAGGPLPRVSERSERKTGS